jgi:hypothetical protein
MPHLPLPQELSDAFVAGGFPLLQFDRRPLDRHLMTGFVLAWGKENTLIQVLDGHQMPVEWLRCLSKSGLQQEVAIGQT